MSKTNSCPECGNSLSSKARRCACGWAIVERSAPRLADHRCEYVISGRRCPLPGTICPYPYAQGPWYCSQHWRVLDDPELGKAVLIDAENNFHELMERNKDWREKLRNSNLKNKEKSK